MNGHHPATATVDRQPAWPWFLAWFLVGACFAAAMASLPSIGLLILPVPILGAALLLRRGPGRASFGLFSGAGVLLLYTAYLNRGGAGTVCTATNGGQTCTDEYSPWPFAAVGLLFFFGGPFLLQLHRHVTGRRSGCP